MFTSTRGIVFRKTRYSETSLVVRIFTEQLGLRSYMVKGARGPKSKLKASLFQPLTLLELTVTDKEKGELHHIREARVAYHYKTIPGDLVKSSLLLFLDELLYKSIREESANEELFRFIFDKLLLLDRLESHLAHFHLLFTVQLTHFLGFFPQERYINESTVFDLQEGQFTSVLPLYQHNLVRGASCRYLSELVNTSFERLDVLKAPISVRNDVLESLLAYYMLHLPIPGEFRSHKVLHDLFR